MTTGRWKRIEELFDRALLLDPADRTNWLAQECEADTELLTEVRELLDADQDRGLVERCLNDSAIDFYENPDIPSTLRAGPYRLTRELGRGGMGSVYLGERDDGQYQGEVAIKLIRPGMDTEFFLERFKRERQALARLKHPNVAALLDSGTTKDGLPYIVMERIDGWPIHQFVREEHLTVTQILRLYQQVLKAVSHAHQRFIVHRDLKPGNILVERDGTPKLLDFGICKLIEDAGDDNPTSTGAHLMTPDYASPEQVRGEPITAASDIFALGAVLYQLLTGKLPHVVDTRSPQAILKAVCEDDVRRPSTAAVDPARGRELEGDLDTILLKALQKDPERRYASVEQFADDLRRVLAHEPVLARPDTAWYRTTKFVRRHWIPVAAIAAVVAALTGGIVVSLNQARIANQRLQQVRRLAGTFVFDVHDAVRQLPGSLAARRLILETGTAYLDSVAATARGDAPLQVELARAYLRIGEVQGDGHNPNLGDVQAASLSLSKARTLLRAALEKEPRKIDAAIAWLVLGRATGTLAAIQGDKAQAAKDAFEEAIRVGEPLQRDNPDNRQLRLELARVYAAMGSAMATTNEYAAGATAHQKGVDLLKALPDPRPDELNIMASSLVGIGSAELTTGRYKEAKEHLVQAVDIVRKLARDYPSNPVYATNLTLSLSHLADALLEAGDEAGAHAMAHEVVALSRKVQKIDPSDQRAMGYVGIALAEEGRVLPVGSRERVESLREAITLLRSSADRNPDYRQFLIYLGSAQADLGRSLQPTADGREAFAAALAVAEPLLPSGQAIPALTYVASLRGLGEYAAAKGDRATAVDCATKISAVSQPSWSAATRREVHARGLAAQGSIYAKLGDRQQALDFMKQSAAAWQAIAATPSQGLPLGLRREMQRLAESH